MGAFDITGLVKSSTRVVPKLYSFSMPGIPRYDGWTKIGYTEQARVEDRIRQETQTAGIPWKLEWQGTAVYDDGSGDSFHDSDFHAYLKKVGVERVAAEELGQKRSPEIFHVDGPTGKRHFYDFRENRGVVAEDAAQDYALRAEQADAVAKTADYMALHEGGEFLWNAKPRFGKTLTTYDFVRRAHAHKVLIVTNRPAIANSWYDDYTKFLGRESGYWFISETESLRGRENVVSRQQFLDAVTHDPKHELPRDFIAFVSLQDLKGAIDFGGRYDKLAWVSELDWDVLVIDEAHEGVDTTKTDVAFDHVRRRFTLHLSGTPFKAIASEKFPEAAIYNWTYADEQQAKRDWDETRGTPNPYADLPRLNLFTYQMSEIARGQAEAGTMIDGEREEWAFDLNEFFAVNENGHFLHNVDVDRFLDALTTQKKYPFSTPELRDELKHTFWMLNRVNSAKALAKKLKRHPVFGEYEIVVAAGDGKLAMGADGDATSDAADERANAAALDRVREAIATHDKTITLSVGQLTTGVTVPEWTAVLMLSNMKSPALYMQAAFRAQNPCLFSDGGTFRRKENAYVFDFDPARTLVVFEQFANDLYADTAAGHGDVDARKRRIKKLLNFFPVLGEDEGGEMVELDAEEVLSIPRKIRSLEVVRRGFMCDFLFQNISGVFRAPAEVLDIIEGLPQYKEADPVGIDANTAEELALGDDGEVDVPDEIVVGTATDVFGGKVYGSIEEELDGIIMGIEYDSSLSHSDEDRALDEIAARFVSTVAAPLVDAAKEHYDDLGSAQRKHIERKITADARSAVNRQIGDFKIQKSKIELAHEKALEAAETDEQQAAADADYARGMDEALDALKASLAASKQQLVHSAGEDIVRTVETAKREARKNDIEGTIRDHLRGFSRTIPSFLMAYGDEGTTLASFDAIIPAEVFLEVTGITVEQFRFLRDGGDFADSETGETRHFDGHLIDPVVFDDSVKEFIALRSRLADYFDDGATEDIFDYIPPQKTNQIYTPRRVVAQMVDLFEVENPGCFDDPEHTFADLYMKSGLYITEIVKRLYRSDRMRVAIPDDAERLRHILERQVFGIAPTRIIYEIATHYILGADGEVCPGARANFVCADSAALAKEGRLAEFVEETFGDRLVDDVPEYDGAPLVVGAKVRHKAWGEGKIVEASSKRLVATFSVGKREFAVPSAFDQGYLKLIS